ncbi:MAG: hypothetical protein P1U87_18630 [Verrucomicrobiales bacterium]|nr:hypothetical protein [Verrucomicrobiales bacterium]
MNSRCFLFAFLSLAIPGSALLFRDGHPSPEVWSHAFPDEVGSAEIALSEDGTQWILTQDDGSELVRPFDGASGIEFSGNARDNWLTVNFLHGNPVPEGGLTFHGLEEETPEGDGLAMVGVTEGSSQYQPVSEKDGILSLALRSAVGTTLSQIMFTGLEPVIDTIASATLTVNGTSGSNAITIRDGNVASTNTLVAIDAFETIEFANKTALVISASDASDEITINESNGATSLTSITIDGGNGTDTFDLIEAPVSTTLMEVEEMQVGGSGPATGVAQELDMQGVILEMDLTGTAPGTEYDQIVATSVDLTGSSLVLDAGFVPAPGDEFVLIDATSPITGTFTSLPEGALLSGGINGIPATISYVGGDGNDVVLTVLGYRSDIRIGRRANPASHQGDDLYNRTGAGQTLALKLTGNRRKDRFYFSVENDGGSTGDLLLFASRSSRNLQIRYFQTTPPKGNVTGAITRGLLLVEVDTPGQIAGLRGDVSPRTKRKVNKTLSLRAQAIDDLLPFDRARVQVRKSRDPKPRPPGAVKRPSRTPR